MIHLAHPLLLLVGVILLLPYLIRPRRAWQYSWLQLLPEQKKISPVFFLISGLTWVALLLLLIALARPQTILMHNDQRLEVRDILLVLDLSLSMEGKIVTSQGKQKIRKLDVVQRASLEFVQRHRHNRLGLLVFGDEPFGVWPLSTDSTMLQRYLQRLDNLLPSELRGTNIEKALLKSLDHFQDLGQAKTKSLLLLTDGLDQIDPLAADRILERLRKQGIALYVLGIDLRENASIMHLTHRAGGKYFNITKAKQLDQVLKEIDQLERSQVVIQQGTETKELYPLFAFPGLAFLLLSTTLKQMLIVEV